MLKHPEQLAFLPVTHVHVPGQQHIVRLDALTIEEARDVIVSLCDQLEVVRRDLADATRERRVARAAELRARGGDGWDGRDR